MRDSCDQVLLHLYDNRIIEENGVQYCTTDGGTPTTFDRQYETPEVAIAEGAIMTVLQLIGASRSGALRGVKPATSPIGPVEEGTVADPGEIEDVIDTIKSYVRDNHFTQFLAKRLHEPKVKVITIMEN